MNLLEQTPGSVYNQIMVSIIFRGHFRVGGVLYGITRKTEVCVYNWQYFCQYSINFKDSGTDTLCFY